MATTPAGGPSTQQKRPAPHTLRFPRAPLCGEAPGAFTNLCSGSRCRPSRTVARCGAADDRRIGQADTSFPADRRLRLLRNTGAAPRNGGGPARQHRPARPLAEAAATPLPRESRSGRGAAPAPLSWSHVGAAAGINSPGRRGASAGGLC